MIYFCDYNMPAAELGEQNPMPDIGTKKGLAVTFETTGRVKEDEKTNFGKGFLRTTLPYMQQDGYGRERTMRAFKAAVLENAYLKAMFLPELGGRLWSLYDKKAKRELLYVNSVFQPCNLGLRNAWFSGGVEFNACVRGHNPLTCSPLYCEVARTRDAEILHLYEFERIRGISYCISACLPEGAEALYLKITIENRTDQVRHMYWWSNIAVEEKPDTRILVPARESFRCFYNAGHYVLDSCEIPMIGGKDFSYPKNMEISQDFFYKIPENQRKWIAAIDGSGRGLLHYSTDFLKGRKLFTWGMGQGGRNWNEFLSEKGQSYLEIQAGILHTQLEAVEMPPDTEWSWTEAYTMLDGDRGVLRGEDWSRAVGEAERCIQRKIDQNFAFPQDFSGKVVYQGSGWGALENRIRPAEISRYRAYTNDADPETAQWFYLLETGRLPLPDTGEEPKSYVTGGFWEEKLEAIRERSWYEHLQLGVVYYADGKIREAEREWESSHGKAGNCWALRNLAMLYRNHFADPDKACAYMERAYMLHPFHKILCIEYAELLIETGRPEEWLAIYDRLPKDLRQAPRLLFYKAKALAAAGLYQAAAEILTEDFVLPDNREGELSVTQLWLDIYAGLEGGEAERKHPLPQSLDFRMH